MRYRAGRRTVQGIVKGISSFIFGTATGGRAFNNMLDSPIGPFAMGGVFNRGVEAYARGGMFTNSIVSNPTMFRFAKGGAPGGSLGLMGESGPEAIMPLRRDSAGNLGVMGGGGNVEVIVNNYSSEKAEAKETVDSTGQRRVEVIIGDMVADQISRPNSNVQQALATNFGTRPMISRR